MLDDLFHKVESIVDADPKAFRAALTGTGAPVVVILPSGPLPAPKLPPIPPVIKVPLVIAPPTKVPTMTTPTLSAGLNLASPILSLVAGLLPPPLNIITQTLLPQLPQIIAMAEADVAIVQQIEAAPDVTGKLAILAAHFKDVGAQLEAIVEAVGGVAAHVPATGSTVPSPLPSSPGLPDLINWINSQKPPDWAVQLLNQLFAQKS